MREALERTYAATPDPKWVVAVGDCGINCGVFAGSYAVAGPVSAIIPVDLEIPGCPPAPVEILRGLLALMDCTNARPGWPTWPMTTIRANRFHVSKPRSRSWPNAINKCRRFILLSQASMGAGGLWILAVTTGAMRFTAAAMLCSIAAVIGGIVGFGSNTSTAKQHTAAMQAAEARESNADRRHRSSGGARRRERSASLKNLVVARSYA